VSGLFLRALQHASTVQPGFDQDRVDVVSLDLSLAGYTAQTAEPFVQDLVARVSRLPGVESATAGVDLPLDGGRMGLGGVNVPGRQPPNGQTAFGPDWNVVEPGWFRTLKLPLVRGRDFTPADTSTAPPVAIVNEAMARELWPGENPLGKQLIVESPVAERSRVFVIGVAADAKLMSVTEAAEPYVYVPMSQQHMSRIALLVRTTDGRSAIPAVRQIVRTMNSNLPITEALPLGEVTAIGQVPQRIAASVAGSLGMLGMLLAAIGIYGVTSYAVSRRTREIGIRIALGADRAMVVRLMLRQGLFLAAVGVALGVVAAGVASRLIESLLFGVSGPDPVTFGATCALFAVVTLVATYIPARRASRVDPLSALRIE